MPARQHRVQLYAVLTEVDSAGFGHFQVLHIGEYAPSNNPTGANPGAIVSARNSSITSYPQAGLGTPESSNASVVAGIAWNYDYGPTGELNATRSIKLNPANNTSREMVPGNFYMIEITTPTRSNTPTITPYLVERAGRVKITPVDKAQVMEVARNTGGAGSLINSLVDTSIVAINAAVKLQTAREKSTVVPPRQTTSSIGKTNKSFRTGSPETRVITDTLNGKYSTTVQPYAFKDRFQEGVKAVKDSLIQSGHTFSVPSPIDPEPTFDSWIKDSFDPTADNRKPTIVPIALKQDDEQFLDPENYMRIGYTKLILPPQSINIRTDNGMESVDILRNQGSLKAVDYNTITQIEISFTAVGQTQYNSVVVPLMQQYNRTPFLPIENLYLNEAWDIDAIAIKEFHVSSMDGIPQGVVVRIIAEPFAWWHYLPDNDSFGDSWCWPLFRAWCEDVWRGDGGRSPMEAHVPVDGAIKFRVPREQALKDKTMVKEPRSTLTTGTGDKVYNPWENDRYYMRLVDEDSYAAITALMDMGAGNSRVSKPSGREVITFWLEGQPYTLIKFRAARNVLRALNDQTLRAYSRWDLVGGGNIEDITRSKHFEKVQFFPEGGLTMDERRRIASEIASLVDSRDQAGADEAHSNTPYFLIPRNSDVWTYVVQGLRSSSSEDITPTDLNEYQLSPESAITNIAIQFSTNLATLQIQQASLPTHQYLGGGDAFVSIQGTLVGEADVTLMNSIVEEVRRLAREYRPRPWDVPYAGFMEIGNSLINTIGLREFIPLGLSVTTVEGFPHVYNFQLDLMEFRQSQRNREEFDYMDRAIVNWAESLVASLSITPVERTKIMITNKDNPGALVTALGRYYTPDRVPMPEIRNPLIEQVDENATARRWRSSLINTRLRMMELYPDMKLPSKRKLDYWISLLKYFYRTGEVPKDPTGSMYLSSMLKDIDVTEDNLARILQLQSSGDKIGYAEPDFYCIPDVDPQEWAKKLIDDNFGRETVKNQRTNFYDLTACAGYASVLCYDQFGGRYLLAPGNRFDDPEPSNDIITDADIKFRETQKKDLQDYFDKLKPILESYRETNILQAFGPTSYERLGTSIPAGATQDTVQYGEDIQNQLRGGRDDATSNNGLLSTGLTERALVIPGGSLSIAGISPSNPLPVAGLVNTVSPTFTSWNPSSPRRGGVRSHATSANRILPQWRQWIREAMALNSDVGGLDEGLFIGIILRESDAVPTSTSNKGYTGLMQLNIADDVNGDASIIARLRSRGLYRSYSQRDLTDPKTNIFLGVTRIAGYLQKYGGDTRKALWAHVAGAGNVARGYMSRTAATYINDVLELSSWWNTEAVAGNNGANSRLARQAATTEPTAADLDRSHRYTTILREAGVDEIDIPTIVTKLMDGTINLSQVKRFKISIVPVWDLGFQAGNSGFKKVTVENLVPSNRTWKSRDGQQTYIYDLIPDSRPSKTEDNVWYNYIASKVPEYYEDPNKAKAQQGESVEPIDRKFRPMFVDLQNKTHHGRLVGAFPAHVVIIVDGGRWIGVERLWDHMYGGFGVNSIDITQSRKDPVDVATVVFSNIYGKLTAAAAYIEQQRMMDTRNNFSTDAILGGIRQFFSGVIGKDLENRWKQWTKMMMLRPGARLHIRLGYGSDASQYPVKFNGVISEVPVVDRYCQVVALGDAIELMRPFPEADGHMIYDNTIQTPEDAKMYQNTGKLNLHGKEPRNIIAEMFAPTSDIWASISKGRWLSDNPYGIVHFGTIDYSVGWGWTSGDWYPHYSLGEIGVNIYTSKQDPDNESSAWQNWLTINGTLAHLQGQTLIGVQVEDASPWKVIEVCRKALPDFIAAVRPFEFRSTLFFGKNWFPFYYRYKKLLQNPDLRTIDTGGSLDGSSFQRSIVPPTPIPTSTQPQDRPWWDPSGSGLTERVGVVGPVGPLTERAGRIVNYPRFKYTDLMDQKAFSQFHVICSGHNLIASNITATDENVITNCQSKYIYGGILRTKLKEGDIMHADTDIYPEHQKTVINHSGILSGTLHGFEGAQTIIEWLTRGAVNVVNTAANTSAAMTIRDAVADMYQGNNMIIGDPYIFPWDYVYLLDTSMLMHGMYQVKEVTNHFSVDAGYITLISPDCLVSTASHRDPSLWMSLTRVGYSYGSYRVWRWTLGKMLRTVAIQSIKNKIIAGAVGKASGVKQKLLGAYKNMRGYLITSGEVGPNGTVAINRKALQVFHSIEQHSDLGIIQEHAGEALVKIQARVATTQWGQKLSQVLGNVESNKYGGKVIGMMRNLWTSAKEGKAAVSATIRTAVEAEEAAKAAKAGVQVAKTAKMAAEVARGAGAAAKAAEIGGTAATGVGIPLALLELVAMVLLGCIGDMIGRWLSSRQCVVIMPLRVNNLEFSAGIEGHMGAVVGDPISLSDQFWASIFSSSYGSSRYGLLGYIVPFIMDFLFPGADSGWNPENKEFFDDRLFSGVPPIQEDSFKSYMKKLHLRTFNEDRVDIQYDKNDFDGAYSESITPLNYSNVNPDRIPTYNSTAGALPADGQVWYNAAKQYEGLPYVWGGDLGNIKRTGGLDCSGFTQAVYRKFGKNIPRTANAQYRASMKISSNELKPGDLVFKVSNGYAHHVGIYIGNGRVMQAPHTGHTIVLNTPIERFRPNAYGRP